MEKSLIPLRYSKYALPELVFVLLIEIFIFLLIRIQPSVSATQNQIYFNNKSILISQSPKPGAVKKSEKTSSVLWLEALSNILPVSSVVLFSTFVVQRQKSLHEQSKALLNEKINSLEKDKNTEINQIKMQSKLDIQSLSNELNQTILAAEHEVLTLTEKNNTLNSYKRELNLNIINNLNGLKKKLQDVIDNQQQTKKSIKEKFAFIDLDSQTDDVTKMTNDSILKIDESINYTTEIRNNIDVFRSLIFCLIDEKTEEKFKVDKMIAILEVHQNQGDYKQKFTISKDEIRNELNKIKP